MKYCLQYLNYLEYFYRHFIGFLIIFYIYFITINMLNNEFSRSIFLSYFRHNKKPIFILVIFLLIGTIKTDLIVDNLLILPIAVDNEIV